MPRQNDTDKLTKLREQMAQLAAQERDLLARQKDQERKDDTRRKVIVGALALEHIEKNPADPLTRKLISLMGEYVKPRDRALFPTLTLTGGKSEDA